jgi:hypothetical protein
VVPLVIFGVPWVIDIERRWGDIEAPPPNHDLFFPMFFYRFEFVEALKTAVVSFVKPPVLEDGDPMAVKFIGSIVEGLDGPGEHRSAANIKLIAILSECLAGLDGLLNP